MLIFGMFLHHFKAYDVYIFSVSTALFVDLISSNDTPFVNARELVNSYRVD